MTAQVEHQVKATSSQTVEGTYTVPWWPLVIFKQQLINRSYITYGGGYNFGGFNYGDTTGSRWDYPVAFRIENIPAITDSVTASSKWLTLADFTWDKNSQSIQFAIDPFTVFTKKVTTSGEEYIVIWVRNLTIDLGWAFSQIGWPLQYKGGGDVYASTLKPLSSTVIEGPSDLQFRIGVAKAAEVAVANTTEYVLDVVDDGYRKLVITESQVYGFPNTLTSLTSATKLVRAGDSLSSAMNWLSLTELNSVSASTLPGLVFKIPLSTGVIADIVAPNKSVNWTYDAVRPSPWRFELGGTDADVAQFWQDCHDRQVSFGTTLQSAFSLTPPGPGPSVNPMIMLIQQLIGNNILICAVDLANTSLSPAGFWDRAVIDQNQAGYIRLHQGVGSSSDVLDLGVATAETVSTMYLAQAATENVSVSGTDLILSDPAPLVTLS